MHIFAQMSNGALFVRTSDRFETHYTNLKNPGVAWGVCYVEADFPDRKHSIKISQKPP